MGVHRRDKTERLAAGAPPRIRIARGEDGSLELTPDTEPEGVHPETIAEERPPQQDDPRSSLDRNLGGPHVAGF